jgi:hypothetical protein
MTHVLKIWPGEFDAVSSGAKLHEVRRHDRDFAVGDLLVLSEFVPDGTSDTKTHKSNGTLTGRVVLRRVTYVTPGGSWGLPADVAVLSIR